MRSQWLTVSASFATVLAASVLGGCESTSPDYHLGTAAGLEPSVVTETRVFYAGTNKADSSKNSGCVFAPPRGEIGLAAMLVPSLVSAGLDVVKNALTAAAATDTANLSAYLNLPADKGLPQCVEIISGHFRLDGSGAEKSNPPAWFDEYTSGTEAKWSNLWQVLNDQNVTLGDSDEPDFLFEGMLVSYTPPSPSAAQSTPQATIQPSPPVAPASHAAPAAAATAAGSQTPQETKSDEPKIYFKLVPTFISFRLPPDGHRSIFRPNAVTDLKITVGLKGVSDTGNGSSVSLDLGNLKVGQHMVLNYDVLACAINDKTLFQSPFLKESQWAALTIASGQPAVLSATVTETRTASSIVTFLATVYTSSESGLSTAAQEALLPSKARADKAAAIEANAKITTAYATALKQTADDLLSCSNSYDAVKANPNDTALKIAANIAAKKAGADEQNLNGAAIAADMNAPFGVLVSDASQCKVHYQSLAK